MLLIVIDVMKLFYYRTSEIILRVVNRYRSNLDFKTAFNVSIIIFTYYNYIHLYLFSSCYKTWGNWFLPFFQLLHCEQLCEVSEALSDRNLCLLSRARQYRTIANVNLADCLPQSAVSLEEVDIQVQNNVFIARAVGAIGFIGALANVKSMKEESACLELANQRWIDS